MLRLSDGGHFENLALLPLLEKKLDYIVVADGSCNPGGEKYADALLHAIKKAREILHCSFTPLTNDEETEGGGTRDIEEDIRVRFLTKKKGRFPRHYRFKVHYYDVIDVNGVPVDKFSGKTGEILFLAPRHPKECEEEGEDENDEKWKVFDVEENIIVNEENPDDLWKKPRKLTKDQANRLNWCCCRCAMCEEEGEDENDEKWKEFDVEGNIIVKEENPDDLWKKPRKLTKDQTNRLNWCCCRCCHGEIKGKASKLACCRCDCDRRCCRCLCYCFPGDICYRISSFFMRGGFPHHTTGNQFFTPDMFSAYHCEGLAACIEAEDKAKEFFTELLESPITRP